MYVYKSIWHKVYLNRILYSLYRTIINLWYDRHRQQKYDFHIYFCYIPPSCITYSWKIKKNKQIQISYANKRAPHQPYNISYIYRDTHLYTLYINNFNNFLFLNTHPSTRGKKIPLKTKFYFFQKYNIIHIDCTYLMQRRYTHILHNTHNYHIYYER